MARFSDRRDAERGEGDAATADGARSGDPDEGGAARRQAPRVLVVLPVDCRADATFLFASTSNLSTLGLFLQTTTPFPAGTPVELVIHCEDGPFLLQGTVAWVNPVRPGRENPNPGMGIQFLDLMPHKRDRLEKLVRRVAYLDDPEPAGQA